MRKTDKQQINEKVNKCDFLVYTRAGNERGNEADYEK